MKKVVLIMLLLCAGVPLYGMNKQEIIGFALQKAKQDYQATDAQITQIKSLLEAEKNLDEERADAIAIGVVFPEAEGMPAPGHGAAPQWFYEGDLIAHLKGSGIKYDAVHGYVFADTMATKTTNPLIHLVSFQQITGTCGFHALANAHAMQTQVNKDKKPNEIIFEDIRRAAQEVFNKVFVPNYADQLRTCVREGSIETGEIAQIADGKQVAVLSEVHGTTGTMAWVPVPGSGERVRIYPPANFFVLRQSAKYLKNIEPAAREQFIFSLMHNSATHFLFLSQGHFTELSILKDGNTYTMFFLNSSNAPVITRQVQQYINLVDSLINEAKKRQAEATGASSAGGASAAAAAGAIKLTLIKSGTSSHANTTKLPSIYVECTSEGFNIYSENELRPGRAAKPYTNDELIQEKPILGKYEYSFAYQGKGSLELDSVNKITSSDARYNELIQHIINNDSLRAQRGPWKAEISMDAARKITLRISYNNQPFQEDTVFSGSPEIPYNPHHGDKFSIAVMICPGNRIIVLLTMHRLIKYEIYELSLASTVQASAAAAAAAQASQEEESETEAVRKRAEQREQEERQQKEAERKAREEQERLRAQKEAEQRAELKRQQEAARRAREEVDRKANEAFLKAQEEARRQREQQEAERRARERRQEQADREAEIRREQEAAQAARRAQEAAHRAVQRRGAASAGGAAGLSEGGRKILEEAGLDFSEWL